MKINKKDDHVELAKEFHREEKISDFDNLKFVHHSFPELGVEDIDITTDIMGFETGQPFFINAMTGGSDKTKEINRKLAIVAREVGLVMASGSLSVAVKDDSLRDSFEIIRKENKDGIIFANLGAEHTIENTKRAIDMIEADGLQIHINTPQELVMPEGDRDFSNWLRSIENIVKNIDQPVMVKEVGFGMSRETIKSLKDIGVKTIDVGGYGGTNFAKIENFRRSESKYDYLEDFGQSTVISLLEAQEFVKDTEIIATGGIRNPMDIVKSLSLGARSVGIAGTILDMVTTKGLDETIKTLNEWKYEIKMIMTLLGKDSIDKLYSADMIVKGQVKDWCEIRNIDYKKIGNRQK